MNTLHMEGNPSIPRQSHGTRTTEPRNEDYRATERGLQSHGTRTTEPWNEDYRVTELGGIQSDRTKWTTE
jgi:hypothetical protein